MSVAAYCSAPTRQIGLTLVEAMVALAVLAILTAIALPSFRDMQANARISTASAELVAGITETRSFALANRVVTVVVKGQGTSESSADASGEWTEGWRIVSDPEGASPVFHARRTLQGSGYSILITNADGEALDSFGFNSGGSLVQADGSVLSDVAITICDSNRTNEKGRELSISMLGRIQTQEQDNPC